jgi:hypothetical protein
MKPVKSFNQVLNIDVMKYYFHRVPYSKHSIFFVNYKCEQLMNVCFLPASPFSLVYIYSAFLGPFLCFDNEVI